MPKLIAIVVFCLSALVMQSSAFAADVIDPKPFDSLLKQYVDKRGRVDYAALAGNPTDRKELSGFVKAVGKANVASAGKDAQLAFYLNAYNALVIHSIVEKYPIKSVMKVDGFFKKEKHGVAGKKMTLDDLENKVIRPEFKDARIHFVLVCGAKSCPRLLRDAATEKTVQKMLEGAAKEFVPKATKIDDGKLVTSQLFNWFKDDFVAAEGSVRKYLAKYAPKLADQINDEKHALTYAKYSWKLNAQPLQKATPTTQPSK